MKRLLVMTAVMLGACGGAEVDAPVEPGSSASVVEAGGEIRLRPGEVAVVRGSAVQIAFRGIESDSRCPIDAICAWPGDAAVKLEVTEHRVAWTPVVLHSYLEPKSTEFRGYRIRLLEVSPARQAADSIRAGAYSVKLKVER